MHASLSQSQPAPGNATHVSDGADLKPQVDLTALVRSEFGFVWRTLRRFGVTQADADDAAQQVFLVFAAKREQIETGFERAFLFGTAVRIASRSRRTRQRRREDADSTIDLVLAEGFNPEQALEQRRATELLNAVLDTLSDEQRAVFVLCEIEQLTMSEVSELLEVPPGTVASRLRRAREQYEAEVARLQKRLVRHRGVK
jgi:RNA polymerase sigma-70 factor (ECF subfamily)